MVWAPISVPAAFPTLPSSQFWTSPALYHTRINPLLSNNLQINENLTWTKGKHTMKFGFDFRKLRLTNVWADTNADDYGDFYFNGQLRTHR